MSLFQSTVVLFYMISLVSCAFTDKFAAPTAEVIAVTEAVKDNNLYEIIMSALLQRVNMDYIDGGQKHARVKKTTAEMAEAAKMPPGKLINLLVLTFRNLFSTEPIDGDPPLKPADGAKTLVTMIQKGFANLKGKESKA